MKKVVILLSLFISSASFGQDYTLNLDGKNDYVDLGNEVGNGLRTIELWFMLENSINPSLQNFSTLIGREISTASNIGEFNISFQPYFVANPGSLRFDVDGTQPFQSVYSDNNTWNANQWYHVAAVIDENEGMMLFIDGIKQQSVHERTKPTSASEHITTIGCWGDLFDRYFKGLIDDVHFSENALYSENFTLGEIEAGNQTKGLWKFDEGKGIIAKDESPNEYHGEIHGLGWQEVTASEIQKHLYFDGYNDYVNLGIESGNSIRTIELNFMLQVAIDSTLSDFSTLVGREISQESNIGEFNISFQPNFVANPGSLRFDIDGTQPFHSVYSDSNKWNANQWYHVAVVVDSIDGMSMYIDGVKQASNHDHTEPTILSNHVTTVGCWGDLYSRFFNGYIKNVHFSKEALYCNSFNIACFQPEISDSTIGFWPLNEGEDKIASDLGPNLYNATINECTWLTEEVSETTKALMFNGVSDFVNLGIESGNELRTIELWFMLDESINTSLNEFSTLIAREISTESNIDEFSFSFQPSHVANPGCLRFDIDGTQPFQSVYSDNNEWNADQWYHVAVVIDENEGMMLFIDGIKQQSVHDRSAPTAVSDHITTIGCWGDLYERYFKGSMKGIRFSNEALYANNFTPSCESRSLLTDYSLLMEEAADNNYTGVYFENNQETFYIPKTESSSIIQSNFTSNQLNAKLYPNPAVDYIYLVIEGDQFENDLVNFSLIDMLGRTVKEEEINLNSAIIDIQGIENGVYTFIIQNKTKIFTGSIIIQ